MKADDIIAALRRRYRPPEWAFFDEIRSGTGYDYSSLTGHPAKHSVEKRLDAWAFHLWPSGGYQPTGFEVKISRSDFLRDVKNGHKRGRYLELCQFFYYVVPAGLVKASEVPDEAGLLTVSDLAGRASVLKPAPHRDMPAAEWDFFAAVCRRVGEAGWPRYETALLDVYRRSVKAMGLTVTPEDEAEIERIGDVGSVVNALGRRFGTADADGNYVLLTHKGFDHLMVRLDAGAFALFQRWLTEVYKAGKLPEEAMAELLAGDMVARR